MPLRCRASRGVPVPVLARRGVVRGQGFPLTSNRSSALGRVRLAPLGAVMGRFSENDDTGACEWAAMFSGNLGHDRSRRLGAAERQENPKSGYDGDDERKAAPCASVASRKLVAFLPVTEHCDRPVTSLLNRHRPTTSQE